MSSLSFLFFFLSSRPFSWQINHLLQYEELPYYLHKIRMINPGTLALLEVDAIDLSIYSLPSAQALSGEGLGSVHNIPVFWMHEMKYFVFSNSFKVNVCSWLVELNICSYIYSFLNNLLLSEKRRKIYCQSHK